MIRMKALLLALPVFLLSPFGNAEPLPPISHWIPSNSVVMLEITRPELLLNPVFDPELAQFVVTLPAYLAQQDNPEFQEFQGVVKHFETQLQTDWRTALRKLLGGGVVWAAGPSHETLLCLESKDQAMLEDLHQMFLGIARSEADKQGHADRVKSSEESRTSRQVIQSPSRSNGRETRSASRSFSTRSH